MIRTALVILLIELAIIAYVRWRQGKLGGESRQAAATSA
jgi:hypothetical protein